MARPSRRQPASLELPAEQVALGEQAVLSALGRRALPEQQDQVTHIEGEGDGDEMLDLHPYMGEEGGDACAEGASCRDVATTPSIVRLDDGGACAAEPAVSNSGEQLASVSIGASA